MELRRAKESLKGTEKENWPETQERCVFEDLKFSIEDWLAVGRTALATPSLLLQFFDLFRSFRFGPGVVEFFPSFAAQRLKIGALRASHWLIFCYPFVGIFLGIE
jgi:hypothetical protein